MALEGSGHQTHSEVSKHSAFLRENRRGVGTATRRTRAEHGPGGGCHGSPPHDPRSQMKWGEKGLEQMGSSCCDPTSGPRSL